MRLNVPHHLQLGDGYCLAACAQMVLAHQGMLVDQTQLAYQLGITPGIGAAAFNILRLSSSSLRVEYRSADLEDLQVALLRGIAPILAVATAELPYWNAPSSHALVLTGIDGQTAYVNDPAFANPELKLALAELLLAWEERDTKIALISRSPRGA